MPGMKWIPRTPHAPLIPDSVFEKVEASPFLAMLLSMRGHTTTDSMNAYLSPMLQHLAGLGEWPGLNEAAAIIGSGLCEGKKFCVWGDYDVDGITSTALVTDFITGHGFECFHHIPDRIKEGYGLNVTALEELAAQGVTLLLTVDTGISDNEAVAFAKQLGMTVVISDHHLPGETLPPADAIVNPRLAPCPCPALAGVGVAFFLMAAINAYLVTQGKPRRDIRELLDLVALGTLADVVDVNGQNRILIKNGLLAITSARRPGIAALKNACNFSPSAALGAGQVVYSIAPRINAAGRLGSSQTALDLLLSKDMQEATQHAAELTRLNNQRKEEEESIFQEALLQAECQVRLGKLGLILHSEGWHPGIIGIVASRIVEKFHRPTVVLSRTNGILKGSGRSFGGFNLHEAFSDSSHLLLTFGGHKMAAGLSLAPSELGEFSQLFNQSVAKRLGKEASSGECRIDAELSLDLAANFTVLKELELLQPFGSGNAEPVFASPPVRVRNVMSRSGFCIIDLCDEKSGITLKAKGWRDLADFPKEMKGNLVRVAYSPRIDRYNGIASVELRLKDWKRADEPIPRFLSIKPEDFIL